MSGSAPRMIVGLGNPGSTYEKTRHNIGFDALHRLHQAMGAPTVQSKFESMMVRGRLEDQELILLWPMTYMNCSGRAVSPAARFYKVAIEDILVVCDDLSLPLGKLRIRKSGSSGGQKGLDDILKAFGSQDVPRLRIGIDATPENVDTAQYVLSKFSKKERETVDAALDQAELAMRCWLKDGVDQAMNRFNISKS